MASDQLLLGLAGNVPYYAPEIYGSPSLAIKIKRWLIDYRCLNYNQPMGKGATYLLDALSRFNEPPVELRMWGNIDPRYEELIRQLKLQDRVEISDFVTKTESLKRLEACDVLVLTLALGVGEHPPFSLPGKMFDYFKVGKPILALVQPSYCSEVLEDSGLGVVVDPFDTTAIQSAIKDLHKQRENLAESFKLKDGFLERFGHETMVNRMADLFDELMD